MMLQPNVPPAEVSRPTLKTKAVTAFELTYRDFEAFIAAVYPGASYGFMNDVEGSNDSVYRFRTKKEVLDSYDQKKLDKFRSASGEYIWGVTHVIFTDLCNRDLIPEGTYIISVSW